MSMTDHLLDTMSKSEATKLKDEEDIKGANSFACFADVLLYELMYLDSHYFHWEQKVLDRYNEKISCATTKIVNNLNVFTCKGCHSGHSYLFLETEGVKTCKVCLTKLCLLSDFYLYCSMSNLCLFLPQCRSMWDLPPICFSAWIVLRFKAQVRREILRGMYVHSYLILHIYIPEEM